MKAKKYSCRIFFSAVVILFLTGAVTLAAMTAARHEEEKTLSGSNVRLEEEKMLSGSNIGPEEESALSGSSVGPGEEKMLSGSNIGPEEESVLSGSNIGPEEESVLSGSNIRPEEESALSGSNIRQEDADAGLQEKKKIALTFDDGPDSECTPMLLDGLAERNVKATFFVIGKQAEEQPEIMQRLVKEGHLIGNHTYNHVDIRNMTETAAKEEILKANEVIAKYTGEEPCFLRPPFGNGDSELERDIEMIQVLWTIDTMDWACKNESKICNTVYREVKENSIILMHDEYPSTVRAALGIIDRLQKDGYEFVTVDQIVMD